LKIFIFKTASTSRWSKDARNGVNAARARSKVASNSQKGRVVASNPQQPRVVASNPQPGRVVASEPLQPRVVASEPQQPRVVASNPQQPRVVENQAPASFATSQLPTRVDGNQPASIFEESVKEVSSSPRSEEVKKPKRRIAYG